MLKRFLTTAILLTIFISVHSQKNKDLGVTPIWRQGELVLKNKTKLEGLVYYNTNFGTVQFKSKEEEITSFQENRVYSVSFFDNQLNRTRKYVTIPFFDEDTDQENEMMFEIIKDFKNFAVLSRFTKTIALVPTNSNPLLLDAIESFANDKKQVVQLEAIFFVGEDNKLKLYSLTKNIDASGLILNYSKSETKIIKSKLVQTYTENRWLELKDYVRKNELDLKKKDDLIRVLDHYEQLLAN